MTQVEVTTAQDILGPTATPEEPVAASPDAAQADERVSPKLQVLFKRERAALEREKAANLRESEVDGKYKTLAEREAKVAEFESLKTTNPLKALELLGLSYEDLTKIALADGNVPPELEIRKVRAELDEFKNSQVEALQRQAEEAKQLAEKREQATLEAFKGDIAKYISENSDRYELIAFEGKQDLVFDVIEEHFERTKNPETGLGEILKTDQAADKIEAWLEKREQERLGLKKVQALSEKARAPKSLQAQLAAKPKTPTSQTPKTLTNNLSATPSAPRTKPVTDEERISRAIAYAKGLRA